jgi:regulator of protease activity HflC (stomatin/prohibitin superfamily)
MQRRTRMGQVVSRIGPEERLVRFRFGRTDENSVRGPGWAFLIPIVDFGVRVSLVPQQYSLDAVPVVAGDGTGFLVDLEIRYTVVDPYRYVVDMIPPPAGLRATARGVIRKALEATSGPAAPFPGDLEASTAPLIEDRLIRAGAKDVSVKVTRVRTGNVEGADEAEFKMFLRQAGLEGSYRPPN